MPHIRHLTPAFINTALLNSVGGYRYITDVNFDLIGVTFLVMYHSVLYRMDS